MPTHRPVDVTTWPEHQHLADNLRQLRNGAGLTQAELAEKAGTTKGTVSGLESCSSNPTMSLLIRVARACKVPLSALLAEPEVLVEEPAEIAA